MIDRIVGHRGAGVLAPENSIRALHLSNELGLGHVEFDVRLTKDKIPVISHDDSLMRCANIDALISEIDYKDLENIDIAKHHAVHNDFEKIPTLQEYLEKAKSLGLHCQVEFKPNNGEEYELVEIASAVLDEFYKGAPEDQMPLVTSFVPKCLARLKEISSLSYKTGVLVKAKDTSKWKELALETNCDYVHLNVVYLTDQIAKDVVNSGYKLNGFHLNHPVLAKNAISKGCNRFTCDVPDVFLLVNSIGK